MSELKKAYQLGYNCGLVGATEVNCNFKIFSTPENTKAWERGKKDAEKAESQMMEIPNSGSLRLVSRICVNSTWTVYWLQKKGLDSCQCGFECKVRVQIERNGHPPYIYIVTKKEYNKLRKELIFQQ